MTDSLPSGVSFAGNLSASSGIVNELGGVITWQGDVSSSAPVTVQFDVSVSSAIIDPQAVVNTAVIDDGAGNIIQRQAMIIVNGYATFLPVVARN